MSWYVYDAAVNIAADVVLTVCLAAILYAAHRRGVRRLAVQRRAERWKANRETWAERIAAAHAREHAEAVAEAQPKGGVA